MLNSLARNYQRSQDSDALVMTRFLFSYVPVTLFDRAFATANPGDELPMGSVAVGRKAATANALLKLWLDSYIVGITDGRPGRALPEFEEQ